MDGRRDAEDAQAEQYNHLTSDMLTENPECAVSALGAPHVVTTAYRGMSDAERAAIRAEQLRQAQARKVCHKRTYLQRVLTRTYVVLSRRSAFAVRGGVGEAAPGRVGRSNHQHIQGHGAQAARA